MTSFLSMTGGQRWKEDKEGTFLCSCCPGLHENDSLKSDGPQSPPVVYTVADINRNLEWGPFHPLNSHLLFPFVQPPVLPIFCARQTLWCVCLELQVFQTMDFHPSDACLDLCTLDCVSKHLRVQSISRRLSVAGCTVTLYLTIKGHF